MFIRNFAAVVNFLRFFMHACFISFFLTLDPLRIVRNWLYSYWTELCVFCI